MFRITETVKHLLILNVLIFFGTQYLGDQAYDLLALHFPANDNFKIWQVVTHMFMHGNFMHILFNMFALWMFGSQVEQFWGRNKFIFFYLSAGLGAVAVQLGAYYFKFYNYQEVISSLNLDQNLFNSILNIDSTDGLYISKKAFYDGFVPLMSNYQGQPINQQHFDALFQMNMITSSTMVGASGAIMGVLVAFGMLFPNAELMLIFLPIPIKAKYFIPAIIGLDLFSGLTGTSIFSPSNTAYFAHVGGALTGFIMMYIWKKQQFNNNRWDR